jgi:hypothetical protein
MPPFPSGAGGGLSASRLSILIPTRNRATYLAGAVRSALAQDHSDIEVIVSDNASTDETPAAMGAISDPRLRYFRQERDLGMVGNWNACVARASGDLVLLLSDDDELLPGAARMLVAAMADAEVILAYGLVDIIDGDDRWMRRSPAGPPREAGADFVRGRLLFGARREPYLCSTVFRRAALARIGGFPEVGNLADLTVEVRLCAQGSGDVVCVQEPIGRYRHHSGSLTADPARAIAGFADVRSHLLRDAAIPARAVRHYASAGLWSFLVWRKVGVGVGPRRALADLRLAVGAGLPWTRRVPALGLALAPTFVLLGIRRVLRSLRAVRPPATAGGSRADAHHL